MKVGDMVKFHDRLNRSSMPGDVTLVGPQGIRSGRVYLVLRRDASNVYKKYDNDSKWAKWHIVDMETGKVHVPIGRDLHVLSEVVEHETGVMALALAK